MSGERDQTKRIVLTTLAMTGIVSPSEAEVEADLEVEADMCAMHIGTHVTMATRILLAQIVIFNIAVPVSHLVLVYSAFFQKYE